MISAQSKKLKETVQDVKHLCLFGVGTLMMECYAQLTCSVGREPDLLCDNDRTKWGKHYFNIKCISPEELAQVTEDVVVIIVVKKYEVIYRQLRDMGIENIILACFDSGYHAVCDFKKLDGISWQTPERGSYDCNVKDRWTLVTGASRGVGRQIAVEMARLGSHIIAHSRSEFHVNGLIEDCSRFNVQIRPIAAELGNPSELEAMLALLKQDFPPVDIVFNNAAISPPNPSGFWSMTGDVFKACFNINTIAPIRICQTLIPLMQNRGFGRVINVNTHIRKRPNEMAYACSKAALDKFVYDLAPELKGTGVMMSLMDPGWVKTDAGGPEALHDLESVIPGAILGALLDADVNGKQFSAQDYAGLSLEDAIKKAAWTIRKSPYLSWI